MTVTPRYEAYPDAYHTGLTVPLQLPGRANCEKSCASPAYDQSQHQQEPSQPGHPEATLQEWACLYHCHQGGVDRIFVDHPLFLHPLNTHGICNVNTYLQGTDFPDVDLRYSILCQAALAAPLLLWHQPAHHLEKLRLQALIRCLPQTLSGGVAQYIGLDGTAATLAAGRHVSTSSNGADPAN